jgi:hypothetical protein
MVPRSHIQTETAVLTDVTDFRPHCRRRLDEVGRGSLAFLLIGDPPQVALDQMFELV